MSKYNKIVSNFSQQEQKELMAHLRNKNMSDSEEEEIRPPNKSKNTKLVIQETKNEESPKTKKSQIRASDIKADGRWGKVYQDHTNGIKVPELMEKYGLTKYMAQKIIREERLVRQASISAN